jgi:hypothetical protein
MTAAARAVLPGFDVRRLGRLITENVERMALDLRDTTVLTEAATGAYAVTPVIAALAGARVRAVTRSTRYGTAADVRDEVGRLADLLGVGERISIRTERRLDDFAWADVTTNSGHLRPITGDFAAALRPGSALSLMFETWEIQAGRVDLDLDEIVARGVHVAGTNERHPHVDVFSYLGPMAVLALADAGVPAYASRVGVLCDNPFLSYIVSGLESAGADVVSAASLGGLPTDGIDAVLVALTPTGGEVLSADELRVVTASRPDVVVVRYWGDFPSVDGVMVWPADAPAPGHMAVLPSRVGPDAIVRLQAGGLKVGELLLRGSAAWTEAEREYVDELV